MVELLPMWLAPNAVTLLGFLCILINVIFLVIYMPDLVGPGPSWLYFSFAAGMWAYVKFPSLRGETSEVLMNILATLQWTILTASKRGAPDPALLLESSSSNHNLNPPECYIF